MPPNHLINDRENSENEEKLQYIEGNKEESSPPITYRYSNNNEISKEAI